MPWDREDAIPWGFGLARKPEVLSVARATGHHRLFVAAALMEFWEWAVGETADGRLPRLAPSALAQLFPDTGAAFWEAVCAVGWLAVGPSGLALPRFERWLALDSPPCEPQPLPGPARVSKRERQKRWRAKGGASGRRAEAPPETEGGASGRRAEAPPETDLWDFLPPQIPPVVVVEKDPDPIQQQQQQRDGEAPPARLREARDDATTAPSGTTAPKATTETTATTARRPEPDPEPEPDREPERNGEHDETVKALCARGLSRCVARRCLQAAGRPLALAVLAYWDAEHAAGRLRSPAASLRSMLADPARWGFERSAAGWTRPPPLQGGQPKGETPAQRRERLARQRREAEESRRNADPGAVRALLEGRRAGRA